MKKFILSPVTLSVLSIASILISQSVMAGKIKCWRNDEGVRECGAYVPPEYSQKRTEIRDKSGRVIEVEERAKNEAELAEIERLSALKKIEDAKIAEQNKKDSILLNTFSSERDINMLRDSKINVIEGIITVTNSNNKALKKKLELLQKTAANAERRGTKPAENVLHDIETIENRIKQNMESIKIKQDEQKVIREKFDQDLKRFHELKNKNGKPTSNTVPPKDQ